MAEHDDRTGEHHRVSPTFPPPNPGRLAPTLERNIRSLNARRVLEERAAGPEEWVAKAVTRFAGSMAFVYLHVVLFGVWVAVNAGLVPVLPKWDESFVILGTSASVEAIFLSTFVLISQNRMTASNSARADLDLHVSLLVEHEVTKLVTMVSAIAGRLDIETEADHEIEELKQDLAPDIVLNEIERRTDRDGL